MEFHNQNGISGQMKNTGKKNKIAGSNQQSFLSLIEPPSDPGFPWVLHFLLYPVLAEPGANLTDVHAHRMVKEFFPLMIRVSTCPSNSVPFKSFLR